MSVFSAPGSVLDTVLALHENQVNTWKRIKRVKLSAKVTRFSDLEHYFMFKRVGLYYQQSRFDAFVFLNGTFKKVGFNEDVLSPTNRQFHSHFRLLFIGLLQYVPPDEGNSFFVNIFGHRRLGYSLSQSLLVHNVIVGSEKLLLPATLVADRY